MLVSAWLAISLTGITSTGTIDSVTVRGRVRLPTTTSSSSVKVTMSRPSSTVVVWPLVTATSSERSP